MSAKKASKFTVTDLITAVAMATFAHKDQVDKNQRPYIWHPLSVAKRVTLAGYKQYIYPITAVLHDVVEDTPFGFLDIRDAFGPEVEMAVNAVSRKVDEEGKNKETYREFIRRAMVHPIGRVIKFHDVMDNLDPSRAIKDKTKHLTGRYEWTLDQYRQHEVIPGVSLFDAMKNAKELEK